MELRNVVLVGGGHSNVQVLKILATELKKADRIKIILISEYQYAWYSGMMPGAISGLYKPEEAQMDLAALAQWAKAEFVQARMIGLDIDRRLVLLDGDKQSVYYDYLSVNIGSVTRDTTVIPGVSEFAVATRPISELVNKIERFEQEHEKFDHVPHVVIVGAGAAGVELAFAFNARFRERYGDVAVTLVSAVEKIGHAEMGHWVSRNIRHSLREKRIAVYQGKCVNVSKTHVTLESNETRDLRYDLLVWATGAAAPTVLKNTGLQLGTCCNQRHREGLALFSNGLLQTTGDTYS
jgi:NADH dehydrogenase FAD-containing subunit